MAYQMRMLFRLAAPAAVVLAGGLLLACVAGVLGDVALGSGAKPFWSGLGDAVALASGALATVTYLTGMVRYWRWTNYVGDMCYVCLSLMGRVRDGWYGPYRKCLSCGKNHAQAR